MRIGTPLICVATLATAVLLVLKLLGLISWPLLWVVAPLATAVIVLAIAALMFFKLGFDTKPT
jgi:hypothetical protein